MITQPFAYAALVEKRVDLIFRVSEDSKSRWDALTSGKKISQQNAGRFLVDWFLGLDELTQSMILGQIEASDDLIEVVLRRLAKPRMKVAAKPRASQ